MWLYVNIFNTFFFFCCYYFPKSLLVCREVVGFTQSGEAVLVDAAGHHDAAAVHHGAEHGSGRLHGRQLPPLRLLVVVRKHLVEGFAVEEC